MTHGEDGFRLEVHEGASVFAGSHPGWDDLWERSHEGTEAQTREWQAPHWKELGSVGNPVAVEARDDTGRCLALGTFTLGRDAASWLPKGSFFGDHDADSHVLLAAEDVPERVGAAILATFVGLARRRSLYVELSGIPEGSWTARALDLFLASGRSGGVRIGPQRSDSYAIALPATVKQYVEELGPRMKHHFFYDRRRIERECAAEFWAWTPGAGLERALDAVEAIDRARWGAGNRYATPSERNFQRAVVEGFGARGILGLFVLYLNGRPAAFVSGAFVKDAFRVRYTGYDPSFPSKYSVGRVINFWAIERCIEKGARIYDLLRGDEGYKKMLGATPRVQLAYRLYRTRVHQAVEGAGRSLLGTVRKQPLLRRLRAALR